MTVTARQSQGEPGPQTTDSTPAPSTNKKTFVEPTISPSVDVLEATTFFQTVDSGGTGFRKKGGGGL
jgi:hypothetical protein